MGTLRFAHPTSTSFARSYGAVSSRYNDEEIKGEAVLRVALLILKYIFKEEGLVIRWATQTKTQFALSSRNCNYDVYFLFLKRSTQGGRSYDQPQRGIKKSTGRDI